jgi:hypothetical protein
MIASNRSRRNLTRSFPPSSRSIHRGLKQVTPPETNADDRKVESGEDEKAEARGREVPPFENKPHQR